MDAMDAVLPADLETLRAKLRELSLGVEARDATIAEQRRALRFAQQQIDHLLRKLWTRTS